VSGTHRAAEAVAAILTDVPDPVDAWAAEAWADGLAVLIAGLRTEAALAARRVAARHPGAAPVIGTDRGADPGWAAAAGATAASALDLDDGHYRGGGIHAGSTVLPVLLAGLPRSTPVALVRRALVAGYEVAARVGWLASPQVSGAGYRASGYAATHGAAAALTAARGGTVPQIAQALRLAGAWAPTAHLTTAAAREAIGWAAATAVAVAETAVDPGVGPGEDEGAPPVVPGVLDVGPDVELSPWTVWECRDTYTKPYPCCRAAHAALDGVLELTASGPGEGLPDLIEVRVVPGAAGLTVTRPTGLMQAQFALPFLIAVAVTHGAPGLRRLGGPETSALLADPGVRRIADRVRVLPDPARESADRNYPARVTVHRSGRSLTRDVPHALGSAARPLGEQDRAARRRELIGDDARCAALERLVRAPDAVLGDVLDRLPHG
jgi:2-methylcitrate dehydratase PrpD